jgi:hypothetical protein
MAVDLTVNVEDAPGALARVAEALGKAGLNIDGICGVGGGQGIIHVLVEDGAAARAALEGAGLEIDSERHALVVDIEDKPGELGEITRRVGDAGVNLSACYLATRTRLVVVADETERARSALGQRLA